MITRNLLTLFAFGGTFALAFSSACSSDDPVKFGSSDQYASARAEAECGNLAKKCGASVEACTTKRKTTLNNASAAAANQGRSYRPNAVQDCIDTINDVYKNGATDVTPDGEAKAEKVCQRVFGGTKPERTPCTNTFECDGALICDGVCIAEETVPLNGGCANAGQVCAAGTYCQPKGGKKFCVEKNAKGAICTADSPCVETLRCVNQCVDKVSVGEPCDTDAECSVDAPFCDLSSMPRKCRPKYESTTSACKEFGSAL